MKKDVHFFFRSFQTRILYYHTESEEQFIYKYAENFPAYLR